MTQQQQRFLLNRLEDARQEKPRRYEEIKVEVPVKVRAARIEHDRAQRVIDAWDRRMQELRNKRAQRISESYLGAKNLVLFGEAKPALKAVEKFEKTRF